MGPVAAPDHHRVVFENERVRVVDTVIRAGDTAPLHTHLVPHLLIVTSGGQFIRRDVTGAVLVDTRDRGPDFTIPRVCLERRDRPAHAREHRARRHRRDGDRTEGLTLEARRRLGDRRHRLPTVDAAVPCAASDRT